MNYRLVARQLAVVSLLIGFTMIFSLPWAAPALGQRTEERFSDLYEFETRGFVALLLSIALCWTVGGLLWLWGKGATGRLYRKEAMAVVGLSWVLATALGASPFLFGGTYRSSSVRLHGPQFPVQVYGRKFAVPQQQYAVLEAVNNSPAGARGLTPRQLAEIEGAETELRSLAASHPDWRRALIFPDQEEASPDRAGNFRIRRIPMNPADALFESQSGFSTTGATVYTDLEDPVLLPRCILFWRCSTHFLGGLGIIVLFVAILGQGSAGKALMMAEMPGPSKEGSQTRMQHTAWVFAAIYIALNIVLTLLLWVEGMSLYDALCHAFGTMATGGFSTYNASLGHFEQAAGVSGAVVEYTVMLFMVLAGTNFTLLYLLTLRQPKALLADVEFRTYMLIIFGVTAAVIAFGLAYGDFAGFADALRFGLFQVVSVLTTTGFGTDDFDKWNSFGRGILFLLMFVGGCAGSTGGGMKVIRHILFHKILWLELEHAYHPSVVRPLRLGGRPVDDPDLRHNILVYFGIILFLFIFSWMLLLTIEPDATWGTGEEHKLIDTASAVAATLNNIGPGLGTVGSTENYANFSPAAKLLFTVLMMIGRLEIFSIVVLFLPGFWRAR